MKVKGVKNILGYTLLGTVDGKAHVYCHPTKKLAKKLYDGDIVVEVGDIYKFKGTFSNVSMGSGYNSYTFKNCQFRHDP
jgi:hypothetical protein